MYDTVQPLIERVRREGPRSHALWNPQLFEEFCEGPVRSLWEALAGRARDPRRALPALDAYLRLVEEGIGTGCVQRVGGGSFANLLERCLVELVPAQLADVRPTDRVPLLAKVWNLSEGLLREPAWVNLYVMTRADELEQLTELEEFLVRVLEPVLTPARSAAWKAPFRLSVLDARQMDDEFLPGTLGLVAPAVLCIWDRRRPVRLGVLLQQGGRTRLLGPMSEPEIHRETSRLPQVAWEPNAVRIGLSRVDLPFLRVPHKWIATRTGFLVASAVDSQRLWVLDSN